MTDAGAGFRAYRADGSIGRSAAPSSSLRTPIKAAWRRHRDLLSNAISLVATTGVTSALGFFYWALAARLFTQRAVGYGSAAVSAMTLLGTIGMFGLGTVLIGELPRRRPRAGLVSAALLASGLGSMVLGLGFAVVASSISVRFAHVSGNARPGSALRSRGHGDRGKLGVRSGHHRPHARWAPAVTQRSICGRQAAGVACYHDYPSRQVRRRDHNILGGRHSGVACTGCDPGSVDRVASPAPARLGRPAGTGQNRDGPQLAEYCDNGALVFDSGVGNRGGLALSERRILRCLDAYKLPLYRARFSFDGPICGGGGGSAGDCPKASFHICVYRS